MIDSPLLAFAVVDSFVGFSRACVGDSHDCAVHADLAVALCGCTPERARAKTMIYFFWGGCTQFQAMIGRLWRVCGQMFCWILECA